MEKKKQLQEVIKEKHKMEKACIKLIAKSDELKNRGPENATIKQLTFCPADFLGYKFMVVLNFIIEVSL